MSKSASMDRVIQMYEIGAEAGAEDSIVPWREITVELVEDAADTVYNAPSRAAEYAVSTVHTSDDIVIDINEPDDAVAGDTGSPDDRIIELKHRFERVMRAHDYISGELGRIRGLISAIGIDQYGSNFDTDFDTEATYDLADD